VASIVRAKYGIVRTGRGRHAREEFIGHRPDPDAERLRGEVKALQERIAVLERIATDENGPRALDREIQQLRTRD
ncbi:MAG: hypothetical protein H0X36_04240, partial [Sphingomonadaceae bacterium]|nr:hypothetical protein [Sphingomonadaceae bacterium]